MRIKVREWQKACSTHGISVSIYISLSVKHIWVSLELRPTADQVLMIFRIMVIEKKKYHWWSSTSVSVLNMQLSQYIYDHMMTWILIPTVQFKVLEAFPDDSFKYLLGTLYKCCYGIFSWFKWEWDESETKSSKNEDAWDLRLFSHQSNSDGICIPFDARLAYFLTRFIC